MEILSLLCVFTVISNVYCPFLYLSLCSIYSYNNPKCALFFSICLAAIQKNHTRLQRPQLCSTPLSQPCWSGNNVYVHSLLVPRYNVFLNHRGTDVKESVASLIFHNLENKGFKVFLDKNSIQVGDNIPQSIEEAIRSASVHIAIFSPNYAQSIWCLKELKLIIKTRAPVIPVFCGVEPSELRMRDENGVYAQAFQTHERNGIFEPQTLEEWKQALSKVSYIEGFIFTGDQGELLEQIARNVAKFQRKAVTTDLKGRNCPIYNVEYERNDLRRHPRNAELYEI